MKNLNQNTLDQNKMKTSNKLILAAFLVFVVSLTTYNYALRAEYLTGSYKDLYRDFESINIKDFNEVEINGADLIQVEIKQGVYGIHQKKSKIPFRFTKIGKRLIMTIAYPEKPDEPINFGNNFVSIACPHLTLLKINNGFLINGKTATNLSWNTDWEPSLTLKKFTLDSLFIQQDDNRFYLKDNKIGVLKVTTAAHSKLNIDKSNTIQKANLQINYFSQLVLDNIFIPQLAYQLGDSSKVTLIGKSLNILRK